MIPSIQGKIAFFLAVLSIFSLGQSASADVRVGLFQKELPTEVRILNDNGFTVVDPSTGETILVSSAYGNVVLRKSQSMISGVGSGDHKSLIIKPSQEGSWFRVATNEGGTRDFLGSFEIESRDRELLLINIVPEETYLFSIVSNEMQSQWPLEAIKVQSVVSRTYLSRNLSRHKKEGFDFCDLTHCQVYRGGQETSDVIRQALLETKNQVLLYKGALANIFFHSTCGGHTASNQEVWKSESVLPYCQGKPDSRGGANFCQRSPYSHWNCEIENSDLDKVLRMVIKGASDADRFSAMESLRKDPSGRISDFRVSLNGTQFAVSGEDFYRAWGRVRGWHELKSTCFEVKRNGDRTSFVGRGLGHGVGMCQWGAKGLAETGASYREILAHYFTGTDLGPLPKSFGTYWKMFLSRFQ